MAVGRRAIQGIRMHPAWLAAALLLAGFAQGARAGDWTYRVRPGDTLWDFAAAYLKPDRGWQQLQAYNQVADPYRLPPGSTLRVPIAWLRAEPAHARIVAVQGSATTQAPGHPPAPAEAGQRLPVGSLIETDPGASLTLQFADGSRLLLRGGSQLRLDRLSAYAGGAMADTRLHLQRGRIDNTVRKRFGGGEAKFQVETPTATSAVRGTVFRVEAEPDASRTEVLHGSVSMSSQTHRALLRRGYGAAVSAEPGAELRQAKLLPAPDLSAWEPVQHAARPELAWPEVEGAREYRVQVSASPDFTSLLVDRSYADARAVLPELEDGRYAIRVNAVDALGLEGHDATAALTVEALPEPPYTLSPVADSATGDPQPEFRWSGVPDAAAYRVEIAASADFATPLASVQLAETRFRPKQPLPPGQYYWRVSTLDDRGRNGRYGDTVPFARTELPPVGEMDRERGERGSMTFRWQQGSPSLRYRFQLSRTADFAAPAIDRIVDEPQITLPKPGSGTWYVRAQTIDAGGYAAPFPAAQTVKLPCRACRIAAGAGIVLMALAL